MPFVRIADTAKVEIIASATGLNQPIVNVLHCRLTDANQDVAHLTAIANAVDTALAGSYNAWAPGAYAINEIVATGLATATSPQVAVASSVVGGGTHKAVPGLAYLSKLLTATRGRSYRGRIFWSPVVDAALADELGDVTSGFVAAIDATTSAIQTALSALSPPAPLVVASRLLGTSALVTSATCESSVAFQRRRSGR
jgi:hypothetical protein